MAVLLFLLASGAIFLTAYLVVGPRLARLFALSSEKNTPAWGQRDGVDFEPARTSTLLPQHFSAIAAAGPIVGPILAGLYFGWGPAWLWLIVGAILIGGIHDFVTLVASVRHGGRSIAEVVRRAMNPRAHLLFLIFVWFALIYVIIAFTDVTASTFVAAASKEGAAAPGPAVATSSLLYLGLALVMGAVLRFTKLHPVAAKLIFLPLVFLSILLGGFLPLDLSALAGARAQQVWGYLLLAYCFFAAMAPVWLLLQPRGELGGYFLYVVIVLALLGVLAGGLLGAGAAPLQIQQPFFKGWTSPDGQILFPILFITVACGACSGFHSVVASGTTSKQLECERDAVPVAYGSMLLEGFFACISLATLMILPLGAKATPDAVYAGGIADLARRVVSLVVPVTGPLSEDAIYGFLYQFALLCFATFVFDTLDACTRLARYVLMEALGWTSRAQALAATAISLALPALVFLHPTVTVDGKVLPLWRVFWAIFGSSNQLLAALTLLGLTMWLARQRMAWWLTLPGAVFMMGMTLWSLVLGIRPYLAKLSGTAPVAVLTHVQFVISCSLIVLSVWLIVEAFLTAREIMAGPPPQEPPPAAEEPQAQAA